MQLPGPGSVLTVLGIDSDIVRTVIKVESHGITYRLMLLSGETVQPMMLLPGPRSLLTVVGIQSIKDDIIILAESPAIQYPMKLLYIEAMQPQSVPQGNQQPASDQILRLQILHIEKYLSIAHEQFQLMSAAPEYFAYDKSADICKWEQVYQEWCQLATSTNGFDLNQFPEKIKEAVENQFLTIPWDAPAFHFL